MPDRIFLRLGADAALGADSLQWILYKAVRNDIPLDDELRARDWRAVSYISSTKTILLRCIREKSLSMTREGARALKHYPDTFAAWKASQSCSQRDFAGAVKC